MSRIQLCDRRVTLRPLPIRQPKEPHLPSIHSFDRYNLERQLKCYPSGGKLDIKVYLLASQQYGQVFIEGKILIGKPPKYCILSLYGGTYADRTSGVDTVLYPISIQIMYNSDIL